MNYLAHLSLAGDDPDALVGQWLGDFVKGAAWRDLPEPWAAGVLLHRALDRYTDAHPAVQRSCARIAPPWRRLRGVLVDLFYDHYLARDFTTWMPLPLARFSRHACEVLRAAAPRLPPRAAEVARRMCAHGWLDSYADTGSVAEALGGIGRRLRRPLPLAGAAVELHTHYAALAQDFAEFYADVQVALPALRAACRPGGLHCIPGPHRDR